MIKHVVFDIGMVLLHWDPEIPFRQLIPDDERRAWFLSTVCTPDWNREQDRGRTFLEAEEALIASHPEEADLIRAFHRHWPDMLPHTVPGTPEIMAALLEGGTDVTLLTNFSHETFPIARERFPFLERARGVTVSGEIGLLKPDRAIYDHHARTFGLEPAATLFFDDSRPNVTGAIEAGWQARHFTDAAMMRADLAAAGIALP